MRCRNCKCNGFRTDDGKQFSWCERFGDNLDIDEERYCSDYTPATNADRIRAMTDEELAEFLEKNRGGCRALTTGSYVCDYNNEYLYTDCTKCWLDWLKEEVDDERL